MLDIRKMLLIRLNVIAKAEEVRKVAGSVMNLKPSGKMLTLRQLKEIIEEIYVSKTKYDERCLVNKMPEGDHGTAYVQLFEYEIWT